MRIYESGETINSSRFHTRRVVRAAYDRLRVLEVPEGESLTSQDAKDACDINFLMARFSRTGEIPPASTVPVFQDNSSIPDNLGDAVMLSRSTLQTASDNLEKHQAKLREDAQAKVAADLAELDRLRAQVAANTVPGASQ